MDIEIRQTEREKYTLWRKRHGVRLNEVSAYIGCTVALLSMYETGEANISPSTKKYYIEFIEQYEQNHCWGYCELRKRECCSLCPMFI